MAIQKIRDMRALEEQGSAFNAKRENIPDRIKREWPIQPTANKESYYVRPDIAPILNNKFGNRTDLFKTWAGPYFKMMAFLKGATTGMLSWSMFHPLHIMDIVTSDISHDAYLRRRAGKGNWGDALNEASNLVPGASGIYHTARASTRYRDAVNVLKGRVDLKDVDEATHRDIKDFQDMGLTVRISPERMMQFCGRTAKPDAALHSRGAGRPPGFDGR